MSQNSKDFFDLSCLEIRIKKLFADRLNRLKYLTRILVAEKPQYFTQDALLQTRTQILSIHPGNIF
jgi:hypothetical protein